MLIVSTLLPWLCCVQTLEGLFYEVLCGSKDSWNEIISLAERGSLLAEAIIAFVLSRGEFAGIRKNKAQSALHAKKALTWLEHLSSQESHILPSFLLGYFFYKEIGVEADYARAFALFSAAASSADQRPSRWAIHFLGVCHSKGHGTNKNPRAAMDNFRLAANSWDFCMSENDIAYCYSKGLGVPQSKTEALHWYRRAANRGYSVAQYNAALLCFEEAEGRHLTAEVAVEVAAEIAAEAKRWIELAAAQGNRNALRHQRIALKKP